MHCALEAEDGNSDLVFRGRAGAAREAAVQRRNYKFVDKFAHARLRVRTRQPPPGSQGEVSFESRHLPIQ